MAEALDIRALQAGQRLARSLYSKHGAKLAARGAALSAEQLTRLRELRSQVYLGYPIESKRALRDAARAELAPLLEPPPEAEARILARIETGGVVVEASAARRKSLREAERIAGSRAARWEALPLRADRHTDPLITTAMLRAAEQARWPASERSPARLRADAVTRVRAMLGALATGAGFPIEEPMRLIDELIALLRAAPHRFPALAAHADDDQDYLPGHALSCAVVSMALGARLGWDETDVRTAGFAGLFADCGMSALSPRLRLEDDLLDEITINRVRRHPALSVGMLDVVRGVPAAALRAIFQHHERDDASGYPFGLRARAIADHAKAVAIADAYCAAASNRPYRAATKRPHDALSEIIRQAAEGRFDRESARALASAIGLFPLGSHVRLSDGQRAVVEAANFERTERPIVRIVATAPRLAGPDETIDLGATPDWELGVVAPADAPAVYAQAA